MRILHVINHTGRFNGNVHAAVDLACAQAQLGHQVAICAAAGGDFDDVFKTHGVEYLVLDQSRRPLTMLKALWGFSAIMKRWRPDAVHAHMMTSALIAWPATRRRKTPLVTTVHNAFAKSAILMGVADRVIAVSGSVADSMERRGIPRKKLHVVLNGTIGSARQPQPAPAAIALQHPAILYVGGMHPRKGVSDLIAAMKRVHIASPDAILYLAGEGPNEAEYRQDAKDCSFIQFVGAHPDPRGYLLGADVFVLASHQDPAPLVISEARDAGCAVVATRVDGIPELLDGGRAGTLVEPRDPEGLAKGLIEVIRTPEALEAARCAARTGLEALTVARVAREAVEVYRS